MIYWVMRLSAGSLLNNLRDMEFVYFEICTFVHNCKQKTIWMTESGELKVLLKN